MNTGLVLKKTRHSAGLTGSLVSDYESQPVVYFAKKTARGKIMLMCRNVGRQAGRGRLHDETSQPWMNHGNKDQRESNTVLLDVNKLLMHTFQQLQLGIARSLKKIYATAISGYS